MNLASAAQNRFPPRDGWLLADRHMPTIYNRAMISENTQIAMMAALSGEALCIPATSTVETNVKVTEREMLRRRPLTK